MGLMTPTRPGETPSWPISGFLWVLWSVQAPVIFSATTLQNPLGRAFPTAVCSSTSAVAFCSGFFWFWLERVSKIGSASHQALTRKAGCRLSFCHEDAAEAVERRAMGVDGTLVSS